MALKKPKVVYKVVEQPDQSAMNAVFDYLFNKFVNQEVLKANNKPGSTSNENT